MTRELSLTFVVDLEADGADALVRLQVEPHLVRQAHDQVRNEAAWEAGVWGEGGHQSHYRNTNDNSHLHNQSHNQNSLLRVWTSSRSSNVLDLITSVWFAPPLLFFLLYFAQCSRGGRKGLVYIRALQTACSFSGIKSWKWPTPKWIKLIHFVKRLCICYPSPALWSALQNLRKTARAGLT